MNITQNTVALVTGGGSGLGEATARRLHDAGAGVVIVDLPSSKGEALAAELGERARFVAADVRDEAQVQAAVTAALVSAGVYVALTAIQLAPWAAAGLAFAGGFVLRAGALAWGWSLPAFRDRSTPPS